MRGDLYYCGPLLLGLLALCTMALISSLPLFFYAIRPCLLRSNHLVAMGNIAPLIGQKVLSKTSLVLGSIQPVWLYVLSMALISLWKSEPSTSTSFWITCGLFSFWLGGELLFILPLSYGSGKGCKGIINIYTSTSNPLNPLVGRRLVSLPNMLGILSRIW